MKPEQYILGIDAGGTKTEAAIATTDKVLAVAKAGAGNLQIVSPAQFQAHFRKAVTLALKNAKLPSTTKFSAIIVGMAGIDSSIDEIQANKQVKQSLKRWSARNTHWSVMNDIFIVRRSGSKNPYGLAQISGTGSHGMGINIKGKIARVGGTGYLLGDAGSGWSIGLSALRSAVRSWDGRDKPTRLTNALLKHYKVKQWRDIIPHVRQSKKSEIAKLSYIVEHLARQGDRKAKEILQTNVNELVLNVNAIVKQLNMKQTSFDIVIAGGMFNMKGFPYLKKYKAGVKQVAPKATIVSPQNPPVYGAIRLGQDWIKAK